MGYLIQEGSPDGNDTFHVGVPAEDTEHAASGERDRPGQQEVVTGTAEQCGAPESGQYIVPQRKESPLCKHFRVDFVAFKCKRIFDFSNRDILQQLEPANYYIAKTSVGKDTM